MDQRTDKKYNFCFINGSSGLSFNYRGEYSEKEQIIKTINQLVKCRHNLNTKDNEGYTLLHYACKNLDYDVIKCLLTKGADFNITDSNGKLPIEIIQDKNLHPEFSDRDEVSYLKLQLYNLFQCLKK